MEDEDRLSEQIGRMIEEQAMNLGFDAVGFAPVRVLSEERDHLNEYLSRGWHADMAYIKDTSEKRLNPKRCFATVRSVISLAISYCNDEWKPAASEVHGRFSRYVYGGDYHRVIEGKLKKLSDFLKREGATLAAYYVDDGPVLEKKWASLCGIGWRGKNSLIFHDAYGSWVFLADILTDIELYPTGISLESRCGGCDICMRSCPTGALEKPFMLNASKCISYWTLETDGIVPLEIRRQMGNWIYGCDICQEVCPHNSAAQKTQEPLFKVNDRILSLSLLDIIQLDRANFQQTFRGSGIRRGGRRRLARNAAIALGNMKSLQAIGPLAQLLEDEDPILRYHAAWALGNTGNPAAISAIEKALACENEKTVRSELISSLAGTKES